MVTLAFVRCGDAVLLLRHPEGGRRFPGQWNGIGGHVEPGEGICAAAHRELREEAGIDVPALRLRVVLHESGLLGASYVVFVFAGEADARALRPAPGHEVAWHAFDALDALPLVHDVPELLPRVFGDGDPVFLLASYDGGDRPLGLAADGPGPTAPRAGGHPG
ncbi:MAG: NUDIX domain-containing protein [Myxococcales bacterium]|nr:NUDIX domain-containing protein [Myxococcales bacterium]